MLCKCGCGELTSTGEFKRGHWRRINPVATRTRHGYTGTRVHNIWINMNQRCSNPNVPHYNRYGGRGIKVCERWAIFENFLADMGEPPINAELDRINNSKGYEPANCRWVTTSQNCRNRRSNRMINVGGKMVSMVEAAELTAISYNTMKCRLKNGLDPITGGRNG